MYTAFDLSCTKMQKLKLLPTLKEKKRYLVYEVSEAITNHKEIIDQTNSLLGIFEGAKAGLQLIVGEGKRGIIRVTSQYSDKLRFCMALIEKLGNKKVNLKTIYVSGLLNKAKDKLKK